MIEGTSISEHGRHVRNRGSIPIGDVAIEGGRGVEHRMHRSRHAGRCPSREILVEGSCTKEHVIEIIDLGYIPISQRAIECRRSVEHLLH